MSGIIAIRNFLLLALAAAATLGGATSIAQANMASANSFQAAQAEGQNAQESSADADACASAIYISPLPVDLAGPVEVRCSLFIERPGTGAFVTASAGVTVRDSRGNEIVSYDQPVGRTGGATSGNLVPTITTQDQVVLPPNVVCLPFVGCNGAVSAPTGVGVRVLPGGSSTTAGAGGGSGTVTIEESCVDTTGGCGGSAGGAAEVGRVAITRGG